jgi:hypothetical protein
MFSDMNATIGKLPYCILIRNKQKLSPVRQELNWKLNVTPIWVLDCTLIITKSMEQSPSWESHSCNFKNPNVLTCPQQPTISSYPEQDKSTPYAHDLFLYYPFSYILSSTPRSSKFHFLFRFSIQNFMWSLHVYSVLFMSVCPIHFDLMAPIRFLKIVYFVAHHCEIRSYFLLRRFKYSP